jgi:pyruvate dehydrogenase E2 component (dihydrolipoamide acetyltransferase)
VAYEFHLPDIGEGLHEAEVLSWLVSLGETISTDQPVVLVQTDKAAVEIAAPVGGKVVQLGAGVGQTIPVGSLLVEIETSSAHPVLETAATSVEKKALETAPLTSHKVLAAPAVRKYARDYGVDLGKVTPADPSGRISRADVERYVKFLEGERMQPPIAVVPMEAGPVKAEGKVEDKVGDRVEDRGENTDGDRIPIRGLRKKIYENMVRSATTVPQVTGMDDLDATELVRLRKRLLPYADEAGIKLSYLPFIIKATAHALQAFPIFNASVDDETMEIVLKKQIHIGIATATPDGLIVPVVKNANQKTVFAIAAELEDLSVRGRERKLTRAELVGSTFTVTSTGAHGGWFATPMVNHPEVAILGAHAVAKKAVVLPDDSIVAQYRMGFSLTFDHRVIDGEPAGLFMHKFKEIVEHPELLIAL